MYSHSVRVFSVRCSVCSGVLVTNPRAVLPQVSFLAALREKWPDVRVQADVPSKEEVTESARALTVTFEVRRYRKHVNFIQFWLLTCWLLTFGC